MLRFKRSIRIILYLVTAMFILLSASVIKTVADKDSFISNPYNQRLYISEEDVKRGNICDINGNILAESNFNGESYDRIYNYPDIVSNITGYTDKGKTGVESAYNFYLEEIDNELLQRLKNVIFKDEILCKDVYLTIDSDLQQKTVETLGKNKGAIVVMESDTGKIKAMASNPSFDSNTIYEDWEELNNDESGPLLNRAAQGLYTPGSTFKIITLLSAMENSPELLEQEYECKGSEYFDGKVIRCFDETVHGALTAKEAFTQSCNCYFSKLGELIGPSKIRTTAEKLMLNNGIGFDLNYSVSQILIEDNAILSEIVETSIGQGKTLVTPLNMAMITSAIVNEGKMMKPYLLDHVKNNNGEKEYITIPSVLSSVMSAENSLKIKGFMINVVNEGTGYQSAISGKTIGGKTGTAENPNGSDHLWFTGFCGNHVVTVVLENPDGGLRASAAAHSIFKYLSD
ncbi:MAG: hypothetical protein E7235_02960 [Lachnospiraceae bacterium]|nr:hypothetical protein [Lachnospiraceae bacterium]